MDAPAGKLAEHVPAILRAAAESTLGMVGLMVVVLAVLAYLFFSREHAGVKVGIFVLLFLGASLYTYSVVLESKPTAETAVIIAQPPASAPSAPPRSVPPAVALRRVDCGESWTGWVTVGGAVGNPCPSGCERGREVGQDYRSVGLLPPRPQVKHKFQCWRFEPAT